MVGIARDIDVGGLTPMDTEAGAQVRDEPVLDVRDLHVSYAGAVQALRGVSLQVHDGAVVAVLGSNGAGKTTLLRAISGTLPAQRGAITGGSIDFAGRSLAGVDPAEVARGGLVQVPEGRRIFGRPDGRGEPARRRARGARQGGARAGPGARRGAVPDPAPSAAPSAPACCPAASSRCSPSAAP